jgi:hypothetical protein
MEPEVSTTSGACGSSIGAVISRVIVHGCELIGRPLVRSKRPRA